MASLVRLTNRKLIKISGPDCYPYLQSLFSNDIRLLYEPDRLKPREHAQVSSSTLGSFMLNAQGRVICDTIIYRTPKTNYRCEFTAPGEAREPDEILIECDSGLASGLANTLYGYRVRRKVSLEVLENQSVWSLYIEKSDEKDQSDSLVIHKHDGEVMTEDLTIVPDPRLRALGLRILTYDQSNEKEIFLRLKKTIESIVNVTVVKSEVKNYIINRYRLGVGEGLSDHPEGSCTPLECNADLLGSISFNKGCYLGQELTARTHYTGVVRKRLMPIYLHRDTKRNDSVPFLPKTNILDEATGKRLGVLRHTVRNHGLALLRTDLINDTTRLLHEGTNTKITTWKPFWWRHTHSTV